MHMSQLPNLLKFILFSQILLFSYLIVPKYVHAYPFFNEEFNAGFTNPSTWTTTQNEGIISFITGNTIRLFSDGGSFPFLYTNTNVFPSDNFKITIDLQYLRSGPAYGNGIVITNNIPPNGTTHPGPEYGIVGIWQDPADGLFIQVNYLCPDDNPGCSTISLTPFQPFLDDLSPHTLEIEYVDQVYKIFLDSDLKFTSSPTLNRPSAVWLGNTAFVDPDGWSSFEVDYIHIESLDEDLPVEHFSQRDPEWENVEYDFSSQRSPLGWRGIGDWGCAMTSAAMVLNYHGFNKGPDGQDTNPYNLNQYLKDKGEFDDVGGVIWDAFADYTMLALENNQVSATLPNLEFSYDDFDLDLLREDIEATTPGIIEIVMDNQGTGTWLDDDLHFVVAKGIKEDDSILIDDPWDIDETEAILQEKYPGKEYRRIGRLLRNHSDISYIWLVLYGQAEVLVEYEGNKMGVDKNGIEYSEIPNAQYFEQGVPANSNDPTVRYGDGVGSKVFLLPKPITGEYKLIFSGNDGDKLDFDLHTFARQGGHNRFDIEDTFSCQENINYLLSYSFESEDEPVFEETPADASYQSLICKING